MSGASKPSASALAAATTVKVPLTYTLGSDGQFKLSPPTLPLSALPATQFALAGTLIIPLDTRLHHHHELQLKATLATFSQTGYTGFQQPNSTGRPLPALFYYYNFDSGVNVFMSFDPSADKVSTGVSNVRISDYALFDAALSEPLASKVLNLNSTLAIKHPWRGLTFGVGATFNNLTPVSGQFTVGGVIPGT
jgi:hypothetical protein